MKKAKIIVIEGTDGSGKETQSLLLEENLLKRNIKVKRFSFPLYDSPTGKIVGGPYLGRKDIMPSFFGETSSNVDPLVSSLYYAADRRYNYLNTIEKEIYINDVIILDRYTTSNMGHQASKAKNSKDMNKILNFIKKLEYELCELPKPDLVLFLHMPFLASKVLRKDRKLTDGNESNNKHLIDSEKTYLKICKKYKWKYINCLNSKEFTQLSDIKSINEISTEIFDSVIKEVKKFKK